MFDEQTTDTASQEVIEESKSVEEKIYKAPNLKADVSQEDIDNAIARDSAHCMSADTLKRTFPWAKHISVDLQTIKLTDKRDGNRYVYLTPYVVQQYIVRWDTGIKPEPFTIHLKSKDALVIPSQASEKKKEVNKRYIEKKRLQISDEGSVTRSPTVTVVGGSAPPSIPGGNRRQYGIRGLIA